MSYSVSNTASAIVDAATPVAKLFAEEVVKTAAQVTVAVGFYIVAGATVMAGFKIANLVSDYWNSDATPAPAPVPAPAQPTAAPVAEPAQPITA